MKRHWIRAAVFVGVCAICAASSVRGATVPSWQLWDAYKNHFLTADGRIVDWTAQERTTSEGQAYGLFFALVANDRASFDSILNWTQQNLAQGNLQEHLPAWLWKRSATGRWGVADTNSASDADLWIAYTLIEAGKAWRTPSYSDLGKAMAQRVADEEVVTTRDNRVFLLPGRMGFSPADGIYFANPSYEPLQILTALSNEIPDGPWRGLRDSAPELVAPSVGHGFAMDWLEFRSASGFSAIAGPATTGTPTGSYDAIRVYLWAGMLDSQTPGREAMLMALSGMRTYLQSHNAPPERVSCDGIVVNGKSPIGFSAAVAPFLAALGDDAGSKAQLARLENERVRSTGLYGSEQTYYDQNLALFARGWTDGWFRFSAQGQLQLKWSTP